MFEIKNIPRIQKKYEEIKEKKNKEKKERKRNVIMTFYFSSFLLFTYFATVAIIQSYIDYKEANKVVRIINPNFGANFERGESTILSGKTLEKIKHEKTLLENLHNKSIIDIDGDLIFIKTTIYEDYLIKKFKIPLELQIYTLKLCKYYRIDFTTFISLVQIESWWGDMKDYKAYLEYRMYGKNKQFADIGLAQLSSQYHDTFEEDYFDRDLIFTFGHEVGEFTATNDYINLQCGAAYFAWLVEYFEGDEEKAVMGYNAGPYVNTIPDRTFLYAYAIKHNFKSLHGDS